jgi:hypothetical protein
VCRVGPLDGVHRVWAIGSDADCLTEWDPYVTSVFLFFAVVGLVVFYVGSLRTRVDQTRSLDIK